jgi:hypothetical protein
MLNKFYSDLAVGKRAEEIVFNTFSALDSKHTYEMVSGFREFFYSGDIVALGEEKPIYIEVKNDSRIADTGNVLCEEEVYYKKHDYYGKGNMDCECDVFAVVSEEQRKIYVINFEVLKSNYRRGTYKEIEHPQQITYCYLLPLSEIKRLGGLISVVSY